MTCSHYSFILWRMETAYWCAGSRPTVRVKAGMCTPETEPLPSQMMLFCWEKTIRLFINRIIKALITIGFPALFVFIAYGIPLCEDVNMK
ncbi:rCG45350, isoform CRA_e [Rattus norvegicus]|uniref:RCG45350, isoform CRA_e n=1 Tax=Rattus norvegicus TaxID=10116 RepID=A6K9D5_RAT|nr:rCG45350, isoform CRA_e [Rattus norvegicus]EDL87429.1 rCG45350, isoform CRA_e [Rattus norvegicus]